MDDIESRLRQWDRKLGSGGIILRAFHCDDGVLVAKHSILKRVLEYFASPLANLFGLHLRTDKCQIWWPIEPTPHDRAGYRKDLVQEYCAGSRVLRVPLRDLASVEKMVVEQVKQNQELLDAIADLEYGHVAFSLLRSYFRSCRLACLLRYVPSEYSVHAS